MYARDFGGDEKIERLKVRAHKVGRFDSSISALQSGTGTSTTLSPACLHCSVIVGAPVLEVELFGGNDGLVSLNAADQGFDFLRFVCCCGLLVVIAFVLAVVVVIFGKRTATFVPSFYDSRIYK